MLVIMSISYNLVLSPFHFFYAKMYASERAVRSGIIRHTSAHKVDPRGMGQQSNMYVLSFESKFVTSQDKYM